ncbi:MAG: NAD-dependent succinate-semialdehyde dehydrogenase, partial [Alcaligenaceae bacterium]|nr:NAD-dependent succinate-semialdehyde dehydrogenase [Alcaligenaceae bacterium]
MEQVKHLLVGTDVSWQADEVHCIRVDNPATMTPLAYVKSYTKDEVQQAILRSQEAQKVWAKKTALERADILWDWYYLIRDHKSDLARLLTLEQGKPLSESVREIESAASFVRWFAEQCRRVDGEILQSVRANQRLLVFRQPIGVTAAITPWNFPASMITKKAAPALAVGCSVLLKPASQTPLSAYALLKLARDAGLPEDILIVLNGPSDEVGKVLCESPIVRKLSFTGSTQVGALLYKQSADTIKKLVLELGGNAPFIVFDDADVEKAVENLMNNKFRNSGQTCVCANRIYVQAGIYDQFIEVLSSKMAALKLGNGLDEGVTQGPLIDPDAIKNVQSYIQDALDKGARCVLGGKPSELGGTWFEPTLMTGVKHNMILAKEEIFGPVCPVYQFETEEKVLNWANSTH